MTRRIEHKIQKAICEMLHYALPPDATFWAVPNGGSRKGGEIEGKRLKDEGVTAGVADLHILWAGRLICLEVKTPKGPHSKEGKQSDSQKEWQETVTQCGGLYAVVRSVSEVKDLLDMIGCQKPRRLGTQNNDIDAFFKGEGEIRSERIPTE